MTLKRRLATAVTCAFATAGAGHSQPTTTAEPMTTQSPPPTAEAQPATTTQTTTTQTQPTTTETQAATTTQTTTQSPQATSEPGATDQAAATQTGAAAKATAADIKAGASVYDEAGVLVGKVDSVDGNGAIVNTGKVRAQMPLSAFGKNDKGLVITATKADLDAEAKKETKPKS